MILFAWRLYLLRKLWLAWRRRDVNHLADAYLMRSWRGRLLLRPLFRRWVSPSLNRRLARFGR